jgi:hypothetical protein
MVTPDSLEEIKGPEMQEQMNAHCSAYNASSVPKRQRITKSVPQNFGNIFTNSFVLVKFIYNEGTKKETEKKIVLQILEVNKTEKFNSQPAYPLNFVQ